MACACVPSARMSQTLAFSTAVRRATTIHLPSGEYDDDIHWTEPPIACVNACSPVPSGFTVYLFDERLDGPSTFVVTRMRFPSGDQSGWSPARSPHGVTRRAPLPSAFI